MDTGVEGPPEDLPTGALDEDERNYGAALAEVVSLAQALDLRDAGTANHSRTVGRYAEQIASELGMPGRRAERVRLAGMLHDIGKIGIPDSILQKPEPLTEVEWDDMKRHPRIGARIVAQNHLEDIGEWILAHHERPDGSGYPLGLREPQIPLEARILAVADAYEAMTAGRPYRCALEARRAREELRRGAGRQFDRRVVDVFVRWLDRLDPGSSRKPRARFSGSSRRGDDGLINCSSRA
ncbi:MAG TPA: HD-GYP domain-containing protein [Solirubrobacteraceae bacterium]|jgi:putative nucleotidyltransferase with HDIG domain|nr:HD-GYP domain-containing protein [Solirubrobacteraceae bacterium]